MSEAWSKQHGRSDESEPGGVPGSEKKILCVNARDRGCVQLIAGEGGSRTSKEVSSECLRRREIAYPREEEQEKSEQIRRRNRENTREDRREEGEEKLVMMSQNKLIVSHCRRQMMKMVTRSGVHEVGTSGKREGTQIVEGEGRTSNQHRIVQLPHIILRRTTL